MTDNKATAVNTGTKPKGFVITDDDSEGKLTILPKRELCDVKLIGFELVTGEGKNKLKFNAVDFHFQEDETGYESTFRIFEPILPHKIKTEQDGKDVRRTLGKFKHIVQSYMDEETNANTEWTWSEGDTLEKWVEKAKKVIVPNFSEIPTKLKIVYQNDGVNTTLPPTPAFISTPLREREIRVTAADHFDAVKRESTGGGQRKTGGNTTVANKTSAW